MKSIFISCLKSLIVVLSLVIQASLKSSYAETPTIPPASVPIKGQYIVVFKDVVQDPRAEVSYLNKSGLMRVKYIYDLALKGFAAEIPDRVLNALKNNPKVQSIEKDQTVSNDFVSQYSYPFPSWGLDRTDQRTLPLNNVYNYGLTGNGIVAYVIDTGILTSHKDFGSRAIIGTDTVGDGQNGNDCNGHGTHVSGTIGGSTYGIAKQVNLIAVRVLNCSGSGTTSGVIAGINWVISDNSNGKRKGMLAVANMSLGGGASSSLDTAVNTAVTNYNIVFAVAAGNSNKDACGYSPARATSAITVGATTNGDYRASYSNYGSCLDIFAPGSGIKSDFIGSNTSTDTKSGTSMAAPHVTGTAALLRQYYTSHSASQIWNDMLGQATPNVVSSAGTKSPNLMIYTAPQ